MVVLTDTLFFAVLSPLLNGYADSAHLDRAGVGLLVAAYPLGMVLGAIPAGLLASRWGSRRLVIAGLVVTAAVSLLFTASSSGLALILFRFLQGAAGASSWTGAMSWASSVSPPDRRGEIVGRLLGLSVVGSILGPVFGAAASVVGATVVFGAIAAALAALAVVAYRMANPQQAPSEGFAGAFALMTDQRVRIGLWLIALGGCTIGVINSQAPLELSALGMTAIGISIVYLAMSGAAAVVSPIVGRLSDRNGRGRVAIFLMVFAAVSMVAAGFATPLVLVIPLLIVACTGLEALYVPGSALLWDGAAKADTSTGEILAMANMIWAGAMAIASVFAGVMVTALGYASPFIAVAVLAIATVPAVVPIARHDRDERAHPAA
jgi:predicted MFS family arabinose efflux permease